MIASINNPWIASYSTVLYTVFSSPVCKGSVLSFIASGNTVSSSWAIMPADGKPVSLRVNDTPLILQTLSKPFCIVSIFSLRLISDIDAE